MSLLQGYEWRREQQENTAAYFVSCLMNLEGKSLKTNVTVKDIVSPLRENEPVKESDEEYLREVFRERLKN